MSSLFALRPALRRAAGRALSVYAPVRAEGYDARYYDIVFGDLLYRYRERLSDDEIGVLVRELPRLRAHLATVRPAGCQAFAGFAETSSDVLEIIALPALTEERLEVGELLLAPALRQIERFPSNLVAVVDKERARTFGYILDELFSLSELAGQEVRHSKAGGTSALSNQRRADNRAKANLARAVELVEREMRSGAYERLDIAGPQEAHAEFERLLPEALRRVTADHLDASLDSSRLEHELREQLTAKRLATATT